MGAAAATAAAVGSLGAENNKKPFKIKNGKIRQSVMGWCFNPMPTMDLAKHCKEIGLVAMEGIDAKHYPAVRELGLKISLVSGGHGFRNGPCDPKNSETVINGLKKGIDLAAEIGTKSVITFTGMKYKDMDPEKAAKLCVETWKKVMPYAEKKGITLVLEHLNSRDGSHPMKGHPGYFGDDVDFCADLVNQVGSKNFKLLFDVYHVQVMNGDVIRRIKQYKDIIGHYHTAGCPGRGEIDDTQEINYPPILKTILDTGYEGYVAQEFIPTWKNPIDSLRHAAEVCDI
ncbi:MAG: TIM barrel protein [Verrucomicrobiota bacterium]|nr:TIM barrel protein [Verrucomicrobiota bacterium]